MADEGLVYRGREGTGVAQVGRPMDLSGVDTGKAYRHKAKQDYKDKPELDLIDTSEMSEWKFAPIADDAQSWRRDIINNLAGLQQKRMAGYDVNNEIIENNREIGIYNSLQTTTTNINKATKEALTLFDANNAEAVSNFGRDRVERNARIVNMTSDAMRLNREEYENKYGEDPSAALVMKNADK